ncbi:hypothetical protein BH20ACT15_BH20ACT15_09930 [soil metagenome]
MARLFRAVAVMAAALFAAALLVPGTAAAHALVGKQDLPIPVWLFIWAAGIVLIVSFVILAVAWREPLLQDAETKPAPGWLSTLLLNPVTEALAGLVGVALLLLVVYSGLEGTLAPDRNFSLTFVFVTFFLGGVLISLLFGNVFAAFNPWRAIGRTFGGVVRLVSGQSAPAPLAYPERLGNWPAVAGLLAFGWLELIYGAGSIGLDPQKVAVATLIYSAVTLVGMALFGVEKWTERGETFSVYFGMFARLSPLAAEDGRLRIRKPLAGAPEWGRVPGALGLVLVSIAITSFDGAQEGTLASPITTVFDLFRDLGLSVALSYRITDTLFLGLVIAVVWGLFRVGLWGMNTVRDAPPIPELGRLFSHTLIPIALAYLVAHYFSLFIFQEQAQFTYLLSDPLGDGSNLFGTADTGINYGLIDANGVWYVQVGTLIAGHVTALALAHDRAIAIWEDSTLATRSQLWMLGVMVGFTTLGLGLLSAANA